jgi:hypothetical protein
MYVAAVRIAPGAWAAGNQGLSGPANPPNLRSRNTDHQGEVRNVSGNHGSSCNHCPLSNVDRRYAYRPSTDRRAVAYGHTNLVPVIAALAAAGQVDRTGVSIVRSSVRQVREMCRGRTCHFKRT